MTETARQNEAFRVHDLSALPPLPALAQAILSELTGDDVRIDRLAAAIERDPGLTARIVGMANSAFFGFSDRIYSVSDAIVKVLGLNMVRSLAFGIVLSAPLRTDACPGFRLDDYWCTAMMSASLARRLAPYVNGADAELRENAYLCGLLHNLGLLVLAHCFPRPLSVALHKAALRGEPLSARDQLQACGLTQTRAGAILGRRWHIPEAVVVVIEHYPDSHYRGLHWHQALLAGLCAHLAGADLELVACERTDAWLAALGLTADTVRQACERARTERAHICDSAKLLALN